MIDQGSRRTINFIFALSLGFFAVVIFLPAVYILKHFSNFDIYANPVVIQAVSASLYIGLAVTLLNLIFGIPLAWVLTRSKSRIVKWIDNLVDLSLVMPTAALGFSIYLYWGTNFSFGKLLGLENGLISTGPLMIILLHLVFTLPYMIRSVSAAIQQIDSTHEEAALTLGASQFTFFRTVAMPLFKDGIINGSILSFTRSLSETGATMIVAGTFATAPIMILKLRDRGDMPSAAGASILLIIVAISILLLAKLLVGKRKMKLTWGAPEMEKSISNLAPLRNVIIFLFFGIFIFLPTIHIVFYSLSNFSSPEPYLLIKTLFLSLGLALAVTMINLIVSVPFAYLIARNRFRIGAVADTLSEIVLLIPTSALGLSLALFWRGVTASDAIVLLLAHTCFTFPLLVKPLATAFKDISPSQEEAAYSLGAGAKKTFTSVLLPQIKPALIAGSIMAFMRSLSETGATLAVTRELKTVSILIVDLFNSGNMAAAAFVCTILFVITFVLLYLLKNTKGQIVNPA